MFNSFFLPHVTPPQRIEQKLIYVFLSIDSHHTSVVSSNSSVTARTSVPASWQRSASVLSVVLRPRSMSSSVLSPTPGELVTRFFQLSCSGAMDRSGGMGYGWRSCGRI